MNKPLKTSMLEDLCDAQALTEMVDALVSGGVW
jgi:hypothetical protein